MKRKIELPDRIIVVDLNGPQGNAFAIIGLARKLCRQMGIPFNRVQAEMMSGDYDNLIRVFESYFGDWVIFKKD